MFLKVAYNKADRVSVYECRRIHVFPLSERMTAFELENDGTDEAIRLDIEKASGTEVYLMNDEGKTIDVYRFPME